MFSLTSIPIILAFTLATVAAYRLLFHPLSAVPGPRLAAVSNAWHAYHARNGRMLQLARSLHRRYGPVVRVGPDEVWFNSEEAFKAIYSPGNGFEKSDFYLALSLYKLTLDRHLNLECPDTLDLLSERDQARYRLQRRLIGPTYHASNMKKFEKAVDAVLAKVIAALKELDGAEVDLKEWMHIVAVECLGAVVLSWSPGYLKAGSDGGSSSHSYFGWRKKSVLGLFPFVAIARGYFKWIGRAFSILWGLDFKTPENFKPFFLAVNQKVSRRVRTGLRNEPRKGDHQDLMAELIQLHKAKPDFTETYLRRMAITNFGAGHETMCSALTSAVAVIASHPDIRRRMVEEIRQTEMSGSLPVSYDCAAILPLTMASIKEAQRLYPALGMSLSRKVPAGPGAQGLHLHGHYFPPGTIVGCSPPALHRNPEIFGSDADVFNPDRWLDADDEARRVMERSNLIWGGGARTCPGRRLAELVLYKAVPTLMREFDVQVTVPPEDDMPFYFMAMLTGVRARFLPAARRKTGAQ